MHGTFERILKQTWQVFSEGGLKTSCWVFLQKYANLVELFCDKKSLATVVLHKNDPCSVAEEVQKLVYSSPLCSSLFQGQWEKAARSLLQKRIHRDIKSLYHNDFATGEVSVVRKAVLEEMYTMKKTVKSSSAKCRADFPYMSTIVALEMKKLDEEWDFRFAAEVKTLAVSGNHFARLPWERLLWGDKGPIPGVPAHAKIPPKLLDGFMAARTALIEYFGDELYTVSELKREVSNREKQLLALDETFVLETTFVAEKLEPLLTTQLHERVLKCLPAKGQEVVLKTATQGGEEGRSI